jgi:hypothetical protein
VVVVGRDLSTQRYSTCVCLCVWACVYGRSDIAWAREGRLTCVYRVVRGKVFYSYYVGTIYMSSQGSCTGINLVHGFGHQL